MDLYEHHVEPKSIVSIGMLNVLFKLLSIVHHNDNLIGLSYFPTIKDKETNKVNCMSLIGKEITQTHINLPGIQLQANS